MTGSAAHDTLTLPWLPPSWAGLEALTESSPRAHLLGFDPGSLLLAIGSLSQCSVRLDTQFFASPRLTRVAAVKLNQHPNYLDWTSTLTGSRLLALGRRTARIAATLAAETRLAVPDVAGSAGLLSILGWYAAAAANPKADLAELSRFEPISLTRRLSAAWNLPEWLAAVIGWWTLPVADAVRLGAEPGAMAVVAAAIRAVSRTGDAALVYADVFRSPLSNELDQRAEAVASRIAADTIAQIDPSAIISPTERRLMVRLLQATAEQRKRESQSRTSTVSSQLDRLGTMLGETRRNFDEQVRDARLAALAEFAAGASHEINNPLTIIVGNAQILANEEEEPERIARFEKIVRATHRVRDLLHSTRQFARPPRPKIESFAVSPWLERLVEELAIEAAEKEIRLTCVLGPTDVNAAADPSQIRQALTHLIRNALEATPAGGMVRIVSRTAGERVVLTVEDTGPGPAPEHHEFLFDPFFCGRPAGRKPGLGLSIAWRIVTTNGGRVRYAPLPGIPGRFELHLRNAPSQTDHADPGIRKSA